MIILQIFLCGLWCLLIAGSLLGIGIGIGECIVTNAPWYAYPLVVLAGLALFAVVAGVPLALGWASFS